MAMSKTQIRLAHLNDLPAYHEHLIRHGKESGKDGDLIFAPYDEPWNGLPEALQKEKAEKWQRPVTDIGWERCWILTDGSKVYGEIKLLHAMGLQTTLHRSLLMMGIERSHRGKGFGTALMREAIEWARGQPTLDWIQLYVFAHNMPAKELYQRFGFREVGTVADLFRVHGQKIDDTTMTLRLREN